ncbi:MAG: hypothetical protein PHU91_03520 [Candidatus Omnitrophica bacterium]|nr:hypothetical protein [Candidatus Omnitrophota bacterium]MDD5610978.1 hypothetical protein [Candidatus Omnitrophota bacterium]
MRDLVYKNITSHNRTRRVISSQEVFNRQGMHTTVVRRFICIVRAINKKSEYKHNKPHVYVFKYHNSVTQEDEFFFRIRGSVCLAQNQKNFLVDFCHSVRIRVEVEKVLN